MSFGQPFGRPSWNHAICALAFGWRRLRNGVGAPNCRSARPRETRTVDLTDGGRNLLLAALFELQLTRSAFDGDSDAARIPLARIPTTTSSPWSTSSAASATQYCSAPTATHGPTHTRQCWSIRLTRSTKPTERVPLAWVYAFDASPLFCRRLRQLRCVFPDKLD
jgi:hypothetical protein